MGAGANLATGNPRPYAGHFPSLPTPFETPLSRPSPESFTCKR
jgi:hypothetical protein